MTSKYIKNKSKECYCSSRANKNKIFSFHSNTSYSPEKISFSHIVSITRLTTGVMIIEELFQTGKESSLKVATGELYSGVSATFCRVCEEVEPARSPVHLHLHHPPLHPLPDLHCSTTQPSSRSKISSLGSDFRSKPDPGLLIPTCN